MNKTMNYDWSELKAAWAAPAAALDEAAIMAAVRREAAARPARGVARRGQRTWIGAAAVAAALAWTAFTLAQAGGSADRQIGLAWMNSIEPQTLEDSVMSVAGARPTGLWAED
jgi:hypothetical protein